MFPRLETFLCFPLSLRKLSKEKVNECFKDISLENIFKKNYKKKKKFFFLVFYIFYESNINFFFLK